MSYVNEILRVQLSFLSTVTNFSVTPIFLILFCQTEKKFALRAINVKAAQGAAFVFISSVVWNKVFVQ